MILIFFFVSIVDYHVNCKLVLNLAVNQTIDHGVDHVNVPFSKFLDLPLADVMFVGSTWQGYEIPSHIHLHILEPTPFTKDLGNHNW